MAAKTKKSGNKTKTNKAPDKYRVRIRMYRQGLGDCFLLSFPKPGKSFAHVMIDCGVVLGTQSPAVPMKKVANNLRTETKKKIDVLVITHEHWDHLSGFSPDQARTELDDIEFGQLWLAWTEDENNDVANNLRRERAQKKAAAAAAKKKLEKTGPKGKARAQRLASLLEFNGPDVEGGEGKGGTTGALEYLKKKIPQRLTFKPGGKPIAIPGLDGVRVYVMGPPENPDLLRKTNPGKGQGYGLAAEMSLAGAFGAALGLDDPELAQPFSEAFRKPMSAMPSAASYLLPDNAWRNIDDDWLGVGERLALQLDSDTNNTSLVLAFEFIDTEEVLLFVGDAQAGNWLSWDKLKWEVKDQTGAKSEVTAADLLARSVFYKVGHHGSHNATLRANGLERMVSPKLVAMMPVDEKVAHETKKWLHMPLPDICKRLKEKCRGFIRIDKDVPEGNDLDGLSIVPDPDGLYHDYFI